MIRCARILLAHLVTKLERGYSMVLDRYGVDHMTMLEKLALEDAQYPDATPRERATYRKIWEANHPGYAVDRFWELYLVRNMINDTPEFYRDAYMLQSKIPNGLMFLSDVEFFSEQDLDDQEIIDFFEDWMSRHPGISVENYEDAYRGRRAEHDPEELKIEWYLNRYLALTKTR